MSTEVRISTIALTSIDRTEGTSKMIIYAIRFTSPNQVGKVILKLEFGLLLIITRISGGPYGQNIRTSASRVMAHTLL